MKTNRGKFNASLLLTKGGGGILSYLTLFRLITSSLSDYFSVNQNIYSPLFFRSFSTIIFLLIFVAPLYAVYEKYSLTAIAMLMCC